ncbi:nuclease [Pseudodesulfovibrio cashew]|uniref:Nuclease n=2 Tax=Pseudodesulfovibrio cashew TaxID=2678688 RepID=A0A6I6JPG4_9BACT|nr:nuclease [Pseudodesulfovibrio cashew]
MPSRNAFLPFLRVFCLLFVLCGWSAPSPAAETARFLSVIDGDSLRIEYHGRTRELRLIGIDAPEWGQEYGTQAKAFTLKFCFGQTLTLEFDKERKDRYGRMLAYAYLGDRMLNEAIVGAGLALATEYPPNTRHSDTLARAQEMAKEKKRGFWRRGGLKETPYQWRKRHRRR